jgi:hypothetical protein
MPLATPLWPDNLALLLASLVQRRCPAVQQLRDFITHATGRAAVERPAALTVCRMHAAAAARRHLRQRRQAWKCDWAVQGEWFHPDYQSMPDSGIRWRANECGRGDTNLGGPSSNTL